MCARPVANHRLVSGLLAVVLVLAPAAASARPAQAHHAAAKEAPPAVPLSGIHVFGDRPAPFALNAKSAMLIDEQTGAVLYAYNEHERMQPASLAKIMTFFLVLDALEQKRIALETMMPISEQAWRLSMDESVSRMFLRVGQRVPVKEISVWADGVIGQRCRRLPRGISRRQHRRFHDSDEHEGPGTRLSDTHFSNPDGLPVEGEYTTAADMVKLGRALITKHPEALTYTAAKDFTFNKIPQPNFNSLLFHDSRVNGIKTGHVQEAGYHLVASATSNGMNLLSAVMGTPNAEKRRVETEKLLDWAFRTFATAKPEHWLSGNDSGLLRGRGQSRHRTGTQTYVTVGHGEEGRSGLVARLCKISVCPGRKHRGRPAFDHGGRQGDRQRRS